ncbi:MAG: OmpA family protein [Acidobacteriota bacterium]
MIKKGSYTIAFILAFSLLVLSYEPAKKGQTGIFNILYAKSLEKGKFQGGLFFDNYDRENRDTDVSNFNFSLAYGVSDKFELSAGINFLRRVEIDNLSDPYFFNSFPYGNKAFQEGLGELDIGGKYRILGEKDKFSGIALSGFASIPFSNREKGVTTTKLSAGGDLILSQSLGEKVYVSFNVGYTYHQSPDDVELSNEFRYGAGIEVPFVSNLKGLAELYGRSYTNDELKQKNPLDLALGFKYKFPNGFGVGVAYKRNLSFTEKVQRPDGGMAYLIWSPEKKKEFPPPPPPVEEIKEVPPPPPPAPPAPKIEIKFDEAYFAFDSYELTAQGKEVLDRASKVLNAYPQMEVQIEGHACNIGTDEYNLALGEHRAHAVKNYLVKEKGIDEEKLSTISYGEEKPKYDNSFEEKRRFNRRAEFKVTKEK